MNEEQWFDFATGLLDEHFPKGVSKERGEAIVVVAEIYMKLKQKGLIQEPQQ